MIMDNLLIRRGQYKDEELTKEEMGISEKEYKIQKALGSLLTKRVSWASTEDVKDRTVEHIKDISWCIINARRPKNGLPEKI
jgi:hypothetical protein